MSWVFRRPFDYAARPRRRWIGTAPAAAGVTVTPTTGTLTLTTFAPSVLTPRLVTPGAAALTLVVYAPVVATPRLVTPSPTALVLTTFAPSVVATANVLVTPTTAALVLTTFAPTVTATGVEPPTPATVTTGVPLLLPKPYKRRRRRSWELAGDARIVVIGTGELTVVRAADLEDEALEVLVEAQLLGLPIEFLDCDDERVREKALELALLLGDSAAAPRRTTNGAARSVSAPSATAARQRPRCQRCGGPVYLDLDGDLSCLICARPVAVRSFEEPRSDLRMDAGSGRRPRR